MFVRLDRFPELDAWGLVVRERGHAGTSGGLGHLAVPQITFRGPRLSYNRPLSSKNL